MWTSAAASGFGDRLVQLAAWSMLGVHLAGTDASSIQAGVSFFFFLPYVLLGPWAGWLADTLPRKWILLFCDESRATILLLAWMFLVADFSGISPGADPGALPEALPGVIPGAGDAASRDPWAVFLMVGCVGVMAAIFSPAKAATVPRIVPVDQLQAANAVILGVAVIASLIGFEIGGRMIGGGRLGPAFAAGIVAYAVSGTFFAFMRLTHHPSSPITQRPGQLRRLVETIGYVRCHRPIRHLIVLSMLFWASATVLLAAIAALCKTAYEIPPDQLIPRTATMMATLGAGMLCSSIWIAWVNTRRESSWFVMIMMLFVGLLMAAVAGVRNYHVALGLTFAIGLFGNAGMICVATLTQSIAADRIRGRVFGVRDLGNTLSAVAVNLTIWRLATPTGGSSRCCVSLGYCWCWWRWWGSIARWPAAPCRRGPPT